MIRLALIFLAFLVLVIVLADTSELGILYKVYEFRHGDKVGHFVLFGMLAFLVIESLIQMLPRRDARKLTLAGVGLLAVVITLEELSQSLFPARTLDPFDLLAGYAGVAVFGCLAWLLSPLLVKREPVRAK